MVESLTSYISRLAEVHQLCVSTMVEKVLAPLLGKNYLIIGKGSRFYDYAIELNSLGKQATDFAQIISKLTGVDTINGLTLLSFKDVLPSRNVFFTTKRWCPICLEEWKSNDSIAYEPLLWNFRSLSLCPEHQVLLNSSCPCCARTLPLLAPTSRNGFCNYCGSWLGSKTCEPALDMDPNQISWENYVADNIGSLIKNDQNMNFTYEIIYCRLLTIINEFGGVSSFSRRVKIPKSTISSWTSGGNMPSLDAFLKICYVIGINIMDLFNFLPLLKNNYCESDAILGSLFLQYLSARHILLGKIMVPFCTEG